MHLSDIKFDDDRLPVAEFPNARRLFPFRALPVLEVDGNPVSQSNSINRYLGKLANLYPDDPWQALLCDEVMDAVEDINSRIVATFSIKDEQEKKQVRAALVDSHLHVYLSRLDTMLKDRGSDYFADGRLTVADLKVFVWVRSLRSGTLDHIPADLVDTIAPELVNHYERISNHPKLTTYYQSFEQS